MDIGVLLHRTLELFFTWLRSGDSKSSGTLSIGRTDQYRRRLRRIVSRIFSGYRRRKPTLLAPVASEILRRVEELVLAFLDVELEVMGTEQVEGVEVRQKAPVPEIDTLLVGTIDRLSRNPSGYTLIDYKKRNVPSRADLFSTRAVSLQMPFYIHLMERNGRTVTRAAYYSFENRRYHFVLGGPRANMGGQSEIRASVEAVQGRILDMHRRVCRGDYRVNSASSANCSRCRLPELCRNGYTRDG
jgi:RecB family exonuclease